MDDLADFSSDAIGAAVASATGVKTVPSVFDSSKTYGTPSKLLDNLMQVESSGNARAVNAKSGAVGAYQFLPDTVSMLGKQGIKFDPTNPQQSRSAADYYLSKLTDQNGGDLSKAVAQYGGFKTKNPDQYVSKVMAGVDQSQNDPMADFSSSAIDQAVRSVQPAALETASPVRTTPGEIKTTADGFDPRKLYDPRVLTPVLKGAASLADTAYGIVPAVAGGFVQAVVRAMPENIGNMDIYSPDVLNSTGSLAQNTPANAEAAGAAITGAIDKPIGKAFGITQDPAYQGEATNRIQQFIGENANKYLFQPLAEKTGIPIQDIQNSANVTSLAIPGLAAKGFRLAKAAISPVAERLSALKAELPATAERATASPSQYGSAGSASTDSTARLAVASPELQADAQAAFKEAQTKYGEDWQNHVNWEAINRQLNADSLPVPGRLTQGQATGHGPTISEEWNKRSTNGLASTFEAQNENQIANLKAIRDESTPDVYTNTPAEHADTLINSYKEMHKADQKVIDDKWDAIRAQSGDLPIFDANQMLADAQSSLKKNLRSSIDPGGQLAELLDAARTRGGLSADGYIAFRHNLGQVAMKGGIEGKAASDVIEATNRSKILPEAAQFRTQVNDALATGRALHQKLASDPAYNAVVDGNASTVDFVKKFVINGKPENVTKMANNLAGNDVAGQTLRASVMDNLRNHAALDEQYQGNFAAKSFNKQLSHVTPVARLVLNNGEMQTLRALGDYSSHISGGGRDSWRNYSNTATELNTPTHSMASKAGSLAMTGAEALLAHTTHGASIPLVSVAKAGMAQRAAIKAAIEEQDKAAQYVHESTRPAAGFIK